MQENLPAIALSERLEAVLVRLADVFRAKVVLEDNALEGFLVSVNRRLRRHTSLLEVTTHLLLKFLGSCQKGSKVDELQLVIASGSCTLLSWSL
jgi:hypothetical protein